MKTPLSREKLHLCKQQANPKGFTDFNDLASKSELGRDGLKRQVGAAVGQVPIEEGRRQQQQPERPRRAARIGKSGTAATTQRGFLPSCPPGSRIAISDDARSTAAI